MSLLMLGAWLISTVVFVTWRARVLAKRHGHPDVLNDGATALFVQGTALALLVLIFMVLNSHAVE